jgi:hypothetical protein
LERSHRALIVLVALTPLAGVLFFLPSTVARAQGCRNLFLADLRASGDVAEISASGSHSCGTRDTAVEIPRGPFFTHDIACSANRQAAAAGLCSATPCSASGQFFAFRTLHNPNGTSTAAGFQCVTLTQATPAPGLTTAQVFAAIRRVKLPGGAIGAVPEIRGLANLESFFYLQGATQPPVDLQVGGQVIHAEFQPVEYRWTFGDGQGLITTGPGTQSLHSEVRAAFRQRGRYRVGVTVMWTAQAFLAGRRVGQVEELVSRAATSYPVAEIRTTLTG